MKQRAGQRNARSGATECVVRGVWAYTATRGSITTVGVNEPEVPLVGTTGLASGEENKDVKVKVKVEGNRAALANDGDPDDDTNPAGVTFFA